MLTKYGRPYPSWRGAGLSELSCFRTRVVGLESWASAAGMLGHIPGELEHLTPLSAKEGAAECGAQSRLETHTLVSYASDARAPLYPSATPSVGAGLGLGNTLCCTDENISPLYAKGGRHGAALVTDLATEHLHALQNGLVTHGCKGGCPETEEAWRLAGDVLAATKSKESREEVGRTLNSRKNCPLNKNVGWCATPRHPRSKVKRKQISRLHRVH